MSNYIYSVEGGPAKPTAIVANTANTDALTGAQMSIDTVHHEVHEGMAYFAGFAASVLNAANLDVLILTNATKEVHYASEINVGGACQLYIYEAPSNVTGGGAVTSWNKRRLGAASPPITVTSAPTVTSLSGANILVNGRLIPGGNSAQTRYGGNLRANTEWILKPNTKYLIRVTNASGGTIVIGWECEVYTP